MQLVTTMYCCIKKQLTGGPGSPLGPGGPVILYVIYNTHGLLGHADASYLPMSIN